MRIKKEKKRKKIAWGITGTGDKLSETFEVMREIGEKYASKVDIRVYLSKAGEQVLRFYKLFDDLTNAFSRVKVEVNSNSPFLAGALQLGQFDFLLIAPTTANTVAKISLGIADTLLTNSSLMALKAFIPVYLMPCDYQEGIVVTKLPSGKSLKLRIRKEDVKNVKRLEKIEGIFLLREPEEIKKLFKTYFG
ncbi:MAG: archaeoflavoprotein AfpA [Candidatus Bathyarchaeota archaeon]|nr:MAG: archaeoflavoprotein AfpA [Candidatus Bathyarchaeota archaeon]